MLGRRALGALLTSTVLTTIVSHRASGETVDEIKRRGALRVGIFASEPPYGSIDEKGQPVGLDIDVARALAREMSVKLEFERVINASRIPTLMTGKVDLIIASLSMYPERAKVVQFSRPYLIGMDVVIADKSKAIKSYADLKNYRTGVSRGSGMDLNLTQNVPLGSTILRFDDDAAAVQALLSGQVDAVGLGIFGLKKIKETAPDRGFEDKFVMSRSWAGVGMRKGQTELNTWCNAALDKMESSGELGAILKTWLGVEHVEFPKSIPDVPYTTQG